jgi:hypothetical protein
MAIVFISPKKKQSIFFTGIALSLVVFFGIVSVIIFFPQLINIHQSAAIPSATIRPDIAVNLSIIDSDSVKNLQPFLNLETEYTYVVQDKNGKQTTGNISAATTQDAQKMLEAAGFKVSSLTEMGVGRTNPFVSY